MFVGVDLIEYNRTFFYVNLHRIVLHRVIIYIGYGDQYCALWWVLRIVLKKVREGTSCSHGMGNRKDGPITLQKRGVNIYFPNYIVPQHYNFVLQDIIYKHHTRTTPEDNWSYSIRQLVEMLIATLFLAFTVWPSPSASRFWKGKTYDCF